MGSFETGAHAARKSIRIELYSFFVPRDLDFHRGIIPTAGHLRRHDVNRAATFWSGNRNGEVGFTGCPVGMRVSRNEQTILNRSAERGHYLRIGLGPVERGFVNIGRLHHAEDENDDAGNEDCDDRDERKTTNGDKPFPITTPPTRSGWQCDGRRSGLIH